ncbi:MAG: MG2 domain-containing protein, partial [Bacteroidia bacterium]
MKAKKITLIATAFLATALVFTMMHADSVFTQAVENDFIKSLKKNFSALNEKLPQDRVYLQFDKTFYEPGDNIWFSAYVRNAQTMKPSEQSDIVHVQFISPKGTIDKEIKLILKNGKAAGDFKLDEEAVGGMYKVKAFTNWQLNEPDSLYFEKEVQVQDVILPNLKMKLDFERKAYGAGDDVIAKV